MKNKILAVIAFIAVSAGFLWYITNSKKVIEPVTETESKQTEQQTPDVVKEIPNSLEGELQASNDKSRGNLMLLLNDSDRIIYLNTSRDYKDLLGKNVAVTIDGSLDDFRLVDIKAK